MFSAYVLTSPERPLIGVSVRLAPLLKLLPPQSLKSCWTSGKVSTAVLPAAWVLVTDQWSGPSEVSVSGPQEPGVPQPHIWLFT